MNQPRQQRQPTKQESEKMKLFIIKSLTYGNEAEIYTTETFSELQARLLRDHGNEIVLAYPNA